METFKLRTYQEEISTKAASILSSLQSRVSRVGADTQPVSEA